MKKSLVLLLVAVLLPGVVLGWLALRNSALQQIVLERRTAELYQKETEGVALSARSLVEEQQRAFAETVHRLIADGDPERVASDFTGLFGRNWPHPAVGFALGRDGRLLCPTARDASARYECQQFLWDNGAFIGNKTLATVYPVQGNGLSRAGQGLQIQPTPVMGKVGTPQTPAMLKAMPPTPLMSKRTPEMSKEVGAQGANEPAAAIPENGLLIMKDPPPADAPDGTQVVNGARNVVPQQPASAAANPEPLISQLTWATADFRQLTAQGGEGVINRFVQDRLNMIFWVRPPEAHNLIFGCLIQAADLRELWPALLPPAASRSAVEAQPGYILALLDDKARPVTTQPPDGKVADWKHPFVASEIGEALPHWEAALYLTHPEQLAASAGKIRRTLILLIAAALAAIVSGGGLVIAETRRQLVLAQKKTDFVSNVSHELKTPLTSIRMFAELMHDGRAGPERQSQYLRIIMVEAERLTRLINNVLDFARMERRQHRLTTAPLDLHAVVARVWEGQELHLRDNGFRTGWEEAPPPYPVAGDADALAQVLLNLLSNAEKYSGDKREVTLKTWFADGWICLSVLDRGLGIPPGEERKIFEAFHRAHDSLASGIQGAGLGLTLAQRLVHEHGGIITGQARMGGGSEFSFRLPLITS